jgi:predicted regulator of Ras-like GTPase activity (Roadblock/LC7/MglB family)
MLPDTLKSLAERTEGALAVALVGNDGMPLTSVVYDPSVDIDMLAAELMILAADMQRDHQDFGPSRLRLLSAICGRYNVLFSPVSSEFGLILVLASDAPMGRARFELRRSPLDLAADLS